MESPRDGTSVLKRCEIQGKGEIAANISIPKEKGEMLAKCWCHTLREWDGIAQGWTSVFKRCEIQGKGGIAAKILISKARGKWARHCAKCKETH